MAKNPNLKKGRLAEVIAAITALGTYRYYKLTFAQCAERISNSPGDADRWGSILREHPEFFRVVLDEGEGKVSLVWRRQYPRTFHPRTLNELTLAQVADLPAEEQSRMSRRPLGASEVSALIGVAVNLHARAIEETTASRWWIPILAALVSFIGALAGALIGNSA
jgi:hypothetical protein